MKKTLLVVLFLAAADAAHAGNCQWRTPPAAINFGTYSVFSTPDTSTQSAFSIRCGPNTYGRITITPVAIPNRTMVNGTSSVNYNLYLDPPPNFSRVWGDGTVGSTYDRYNGSAQNKDFNDFIYGTVPAGQSLQPGTYTDTVNVTLWQGNSANGPWTAVAPVTGQPVTVTLTVAPECRVDTFALSFGNYDPFSAGALSQSTVVKVYCTPGTTATTTTLDNGLYPNLTQRRMFSGSAYLNYDAALTGATGGTSTSSLLPIGGGFPLIGTVAAGQDVPVGAYSDSLQATVNY